MRTLIVDDETLARNYLRQLINNQLDIEIIGEASQGCEAVTKIKSLSPDLLFIDVQMPELDGFGVLKSLAPKELPPLVVFVTAYDSHALKAFEARALDYLLKPFDEDRFDNCLDRVRAHWRGTHTDSGTERIIALLHELRPSIHLTSLTVKRKDRVHVIQTDEVDWISSDDKYVIVHARGEEYLLRDSLSSLESRLNPSSFLRIHRSTIVNLRKIRSLEPLFHGDYKVSLEGGQHLVLSRRHRAQLEAVLGHF